MSPSIIGKASEEQLEEIEELIDEGLYDDESSFVQFAVQYTLDNNYNIQTEPYN